MFQAFFQEFTLVNILVTNDDGINSEGLKTLADTLKEIGDVYVVAPDRQRSAVGLSVTLEHPLRIRNVGEKTYSVDGMPADCVTLAVHNILDSSPDLLVSGINDGQNLGYDIYHSGTVGAAILGTMFGIPSMAVSIANKQFDDTYEDVFWYGSAAQIALKIARNVLKYKLPIGTYLNVNVPNVPLPEIEGIEISRHGSVTYDIEIQHRLDPRGRKYYWVGGEFRRESEHSETDLDILRQRKVSVTPLRLDLTDYSVIDELSHWIND
ncbi:5'/3'-nucleotidase SurE [Candidatus Poribacteria bacterium]|nr:5'/3'-nucleotidase SurE [Candidatus Poribacteria bacterium]